MNRLFSLLSGERLFLLIYGVIAIVLFLLLLFKLPRRKSQFRSGDDTEKELFSSLSAEDYLRWAEENFDPYQVLEISPQANPRQITEAFRKKMKQFHPDRVSHLSPEERKLALERSILVIRAKELLLSKVDKSGFQG
ncbi:MAG: J domain-containing protein [Deltaproteobacteria bacterium]|nr:J domain-containing protein [Deltaproteobacteria bacterium]